MAILNILQLNYFLCCANQICFQQVFLTAQGRNWAKLLYRGASPKTHTDTAELEAEWWDYSKFHGDKHSLLSKYMSKALQLSQADCCGHLCPYLSSHQQFRDTKGTHLTRMALERKAITQRSLQLCGDLRQLRFQQDPNRRILITNTDKYLHVCKEHQPFLSLTTVILS